MEGNIKMGICGICSENVSKYKCPKCLICYCSMSCYKSEGHVQCSENFYKQCFMDVLKDNGVDDDSKAKYREMLSRMEKQLDLDSVGEVKNLEEPDFVSAMDHKEKELWNMLSVEEKRAFCDMRDFDSLVQLWEPWWLQSNFPLIEDEMRMDEILKSIPSLCSTVKLTELTGISKPSDKLPFNVLNIIYGYAYVMRLYNGDCVDLPVDVALTLQSISSALGDSVFPDASQAIGHCITSLNVDQNAKEFSVAIIRDVIAILKGPNRFRTTLFIESCLSHCLTIFNKASKLLRNKKFAEDYNDSSSLSAAELRKLLLRISKKLEFLISWAKDYGDSVSKLAHIVEGELHTHLSTLTQMKEDKKFLEETVGNRSLLVSGPKIIEL